MPEAAEAGSHTEAELLEQPSTHRASWGRCGAASLLALSVGLGVATWALALLASRSPSGRGEKRAGASHRVLEGPAICSGEPAEEQLLKGEILGSICSHLGEGSNMLVFGNGYDSPFWMESNSKGVVRFLEDEQEWIDKQPRQVREASTLVHYTCNMKTAPYEVDDEEMLSEFHRKQLPSDVRSTAWDVILVDAPAGWGDDTPGRGQSIYAASKLAGPNSYVYVNECMRRVEDLYCQLWFERQGWTRLVHQDNGMGGQVCLFYMNETMRERASTTTFTQTTSTMTKTAVKHFIDSPVHVSPISSESTTSTTTARASRTSSAGPTADPYSGEAPQSAAGDSGRPSSSGPSVELPFVTTTGGAADAHSLGAQLDRMGNVPMGDKMEKPTPKPEAHGTFNVLGISFG